MNCPDCGSSFDAPDRRFTRCRRCQWRVADVAWAEMEAHKLATEWLESCPPLFRQTDPARLPQKALAEVLAWKYSPRGLILYGPTGTGKTRAAFLLLHHLALNDNRSAEVFLAGDFERAVAVYFGPKGDPDRWLRSLRAVDVLFLDDLGKGKLTERAEAELFNLIDMRAAHLKPIIATTNFTGLALASRVSPDRGPPLLRRLREFCQQVEFSPTVVTSHPA